MLAFAGLCAGLRGHSRFAATDTPGEGGFRRRMQSEMAVSRGYEHLNLYEACEVVFVERK